MPQKYREIIEQYYNQIWQIKANIKYSCKSQLHTMKRLILNTSEQGGG